MLSEAYKYLTTPCAPHLKAMGYLKELIALEARYQRCQSAWQPHLDHTKSLIIEAVNATKIRKKVIVLGAGILSDIPIKTLSESFETVVLIDVCFLKKTRTQTKVYTNIEWQKCDVTGVAGSMYNWAQAGKGAHELPEPTLPADSNNLKNADLVISANILSQLPLIPIAFAKKTPASLSEDTLTKLSQNILINHMAYLQTCQGTVCLISEIERQFCTNGRIIEVEDPLWGYNLKRDRAEWLWELAPRGEISKDFAVRNRVIGAYWHNEHLN